MDIVIDTEGDEPLFAQLMEQIKQAVSTGQVQAGDALPSIRQLATDLELNNKTVAKAYSLLERDAVIQSKGYRGSFVHPDAKANCRVDRSSVVTEALTTTINDLRHSGATDSEIRIAFGNVMNSQKA